MTHTEHTQPDTTRSEAKLRDLLIIRSYLRERRDDLSINPFVQRVFAFEVSQINKAITKAEAEAAQ